MSVVSAHCLCPPWDNISIVYKRMMMAYSNRVREMCRALTVVCVLAVFLHLALYVLSHTHQRYGKIHIVQRWLKRPLPAAICCGVLLVQHAREHTFLS